MLRCVKLMCALILLSESLSIAQESRYAAVDRPRSGDTPPCWDGKPSFAHELGNYLNIIVGGDQDVACKLVNINTDSCIRYVYVRAGDTSAVRNIPEGRYSVKIAYGNDWMADTARGACSGRFRRDASYQKSREILDFTTKRTEEGILVPSFELLLEASALRSASEFPTEPIDAEEFVK